MPTPSTTEINAAIVKIMEAAELADDVVNGPASGAGSDVTVTSGVVPTLAKRAAAEAALQAAFVASGAEAIASVEAAVASLIAGGAAATLELLGIPSHASLAIANTALPIGHPYFDTTLNKLAITTE
jgi:hypothetical protein